MHRLIATALLSILIGFGYGQSTLSDSLQAWYPLNGTVVDSSGNGLHATLNGAILTTDRFGQAAAAYLFDGIDDFLLLPDDFDYPERTINLWFSAPDITDSTGQLYGSDHPGLQHGSSTMRAVVENGQKVIRWVQGGDSSTWHSATVQENQWYMATFIVDTLETRYYLNAHLQATVGKFAGTSNNAVITTSTIATDRNQNLFAHASIDDIRIYNRALGICELRELYLGDSLFPRITIVNDSLVATPGASYQWNRDGSPIEGATQQALPITQNGSYTVTVVDSAGCVFTSAAVAVTHVGLPEGFISDAITVFPNPTTGMVSVSSQQPVMVQVTDLEGRVIRPASRQRVIDLRDQAKGVYLLKVSGSGGTRVFKVMVVD